MAEYIEREALINHVEDLPTWGADGTMLDREDVICSIENRIAADVAPVRHGRWDSVKNPQWPAYSHDKCSICGWWNTKNALCYDGNKKPGHSLNYCPNCGADMRGINDE